jgi:uncharacterized protein (DUF58 family)
VADQEDFVLPEAFAQVLRHLQPIGYKLLFVERRAIRRLQAGKPCAALIPLHDDEMLLQLLLVIAQDGDVR